VANTDLRPMTLGEVLDRTFKLYKEHFLLFLGIFAIPYLLVMIFSVGYVVLLADPMLARGMANNPTVPLELFGRFLVGFVVMALLYLLVFASAQSATVMAVSDLYLGRPTGLALSYSRVRGRILRVSLVMILIGLLVGAAASVPMLLAATLIAALHGSALGMLLMIPVFLAAPVIMIILFCRMSVAVPAATLEETGATGAMSRSFRLTKGSTAQIFAVYVLVMFLTFLAMMVFQVPFLLAAGSPFKPHALSFGLMVMQEVGAWVPSVIVAPIGTIAISLIYYNQRVRKEAFDLEHLMASLEPGETPPAPSVA
jgi:hypothetical protein